MKYYKWTYVRSNYGVSVYTMIGKKFKSRFFNDLYMTLFIKNDNGDYVSLKNFRRGLPILHHKADVENFEEIDKKEIFLLML